MAHTSRGYWNERYATNPCLGSGLGSQGDILAYKRTLLEKLSSRYSASSVLDVGCGDMAVGEALPEQGYIGIDFSNVVTSLNGARFPARRFVCGDFLELDLAQAEMVICLDVLIHIASADDYRRFAKRLVTLCRTAGVVTGFEVPPSYLSEITFYHEPLGQTLARAGAVNVRKVGGYRQVAVFAFGPAEEAISTQDGRFNGLIRKPVFLVGAMRSGTTLLAELLGQSSHVCHCSFELKDLWSKVGGVSMASAKTRDETCFELRAEDARPDIASQLTRAFFQRMEQCGPKSPQALFLNKNPHLCNKLHFVLGLFPDARFIWIHRHMPQVVASLKRLFIDVQHRQGTWHWWPQADPRVRNRCWNAFHVEGVRPPVDDVRVFPGGT